MKKVYITGDIGWEVTAKTVGRQLRAANGEDVEIDIASGGGSVYEGLKIYNEIKNYKGGVTFRLTGLVASMASYIALARGPENVIAENNAIFMIHNVSGGMWGDYRDMGKMTQLLDDLTTHLSKVYSDATGATTDEIRAMLDAETYLFGQEIVDGGFASTLIDTGADNDPDVTAMIALAKIEVHNITAKVREQELSQNQVDEINNMVGHGAKPEPKNTPATPAAVVKKQVTKMMTLEELQEKEPKAYAAAVALGMSEGQKGERARVSRITAFRAKMPVNMQAVVDTAITNGDNFEDFSLNAQLALHAGGEIAAGAAEAGALPVGTNAPIVTAVADGDITTPEQLVATSDAIAAMVGLSPTKAVQ